MGMALLEKLPYIILCFLIGAVLFNAFAYFLIKPTYQSTAKLYVVSASDDSIVNLQDLNIGSSLTKDYEDLILSYPVLDQVIEKLGLKKGDFVGLTAGKKGDALKGAGVLRKYLGMNSEAHMKQNCYEFCWIVDFPMYEIGEESGELEFCHNPFSMPQGGMDALCNADPLSINAYQYDLVCNGVELSSGAVRNHDPEIMVKAFEIVGLGEDAVKAKFPAMYNAFCYGAPPHAGIAPGVDRMVMLLAGEESIREIIPFPMNKTAQDVMMGAPSAVDEKQLRDVHIKIDLPKED